MPFPVTIKYIIEAEHELGLLFPTDFKAKMIQENGGDIATEEDDWQLFPFFDKSDAKRMSRTCNHIIHETNQARSWSNFPDNAIAIASNGCGDNLILLPSDKDTKNLGEEIYIWYHETGEIQEIAASIIELME